jgi:carbamoyl-phosphate synthase small subunit
MGSMNGSKGVVEAALVLADGQVFEGEAVGAVQSNGVSSGEVVFNTVLSGYQEVLTDPSYAGQIITFTYPHIGNYGVNATDYESRKMFCRGVVVRDLARRHSNWRAESSLDAMLQAQGVSGIAGIDTRRLTKHLRDSGAMTGAFGTASEVALLAAAQADPGTDGTDLAAFVTTPKPYVVAAHDPSNPTRIVAYDFGIKTTIVRHLAGLGTVHVVPAGTTAEEALSLNPHGIFLSNGPGDPTEVVGAVEAIGSLLGRVPVFGICLGHQLLGLTLGAATVKLPFGHHGGNHPVKNLATGMIEITSQNHNFAVDAHALPSGVTMSHVNLNDEVCEGLAAPSHNAFSVQYHPEAGPGPHDSRYLFAQFADMMQVGATGAGV